MKKKIPSVNRTKQLGLLILGLLLVVVCLNHRQADPSAKQSATDEKKSAIPRADSRGDSKPDALGMWETHPKVDSLTSSQTFSSSVNVNIEAGETLVMGGYQREDGNHEFTMLTPTLVTLEDGSQAIRLVSKVMALNPDAAYQSGLNTLTTRYPTADDHAEAWTQQELRSTMLSASKAAGCELMTGPTFTGMPGEAFSLKVGGANGISEYSIEATVSNHAEGGFSIQSRVERNSKSHFDAAAD